MGIESVQAFDLAGNRYDKASEGAGQLTEPGSPVAARSGLMDRAKTPCVVSLPVK